MPTKCPLTVFYDGACGVCSSEMSYYRSIADQSIVFIDIASEDFRAEAYGKEAADFLRELHVLDDRGQFHTGVEAFRTLWNELPSPFYPFLSTFVGLPGINMATRSGYAVFAKFRHFLPSGKSCTIAKR